MGKSCPIAIEGLFTYLQRVGWLLDFLVAELILLLQNSYVMGYLPLKHSNLMGLIRYIGKRWSLL